MKKAAFTIIFSLSLILGFAQPSSLFYMTNIRQNVYTNPARVSDCGFSFSLPALNLDFMLYSNPLNYSKIFSQNDSGTFYIDFKNISKYLDKYNYLLIDQRISLFSFGMLFDKLYFYYDYSLKYNIIPYYSSGLFDFLANGNPDGVIDLSGFGINATVYTQSSFNFAYKISPKLSVGAGIKFNRGYFNIQTNEFNAKAIVDTSAGSNYAMSLSANYEIVSAGIIKPYYDKYGDLNFAISPDFTNMQSSTSQIIDTVLAVLKTPNTGVAVDLGISYKPIKYLQLNASIIDLGFIKWTKNSNILTGEIKDITIDGYDLNDSTKFQNLIDTILTSLKPQITNSTYKTSLYTKVYLGAAFTPTDYLTIALHYKGTKLPSNWYNIYTAGVYFNPGYNWSFNINYSIYPNSPNNLGAGFAFKFGPMQFFALTDNIALPNFGISYFTNSTTPYYDNSATLRVKNTQVVNFMFGINFNFSCKDRTDYGLLN